MQKVTFLSTPQIVRIHDQQIEFHGGMPGIRDQGLLESAVSAPKASFGGELLHSTIYNKAAAYFISLAKNHAFIDGNKRTAAMTVFAFLYTNGFILELEEDVLVEYAIQVATEKVDNEEVAAYLEVHTTLQVTAKG